MKTRVWNTVKKIGIALVNVVSVTLIVCALFVLLTVVMNRGNGNVDLFGISLFRVMTGSMEPELHEDSLIVVKKIAPAEVEEGMIITFFSADPTLNGLPNTHRVKAITVEGGQYFFTTKGDANPGEDSDPVPERNLIGKVIWKSLILGKVVHLASNPLVFIPLIVIPLIAMILTNFLKALKTTKQIMREEERAAIEAYKEKKRAEAEASSAAETETAAGDAEKEDPGQ